jgi:GTP cyclohydrolase II
MNNSQQVEITLQTYAGDVRMKAISGFGKSGVLLIREPFESPVCVRVHSSCLFSESFGSGECDCADQLRMSLAHIGEHGGVVVYVYDEGRGVGLENKIKSISLQQRLDLDTAEAFKHLGFEPDMRSYELAAAALRDVVGGASIRLMTNNPEKVKRLSELGVCIHSTMKLVSSRPEVASYMKEKEEALGHEFS